MSDILERLRGYNPLDRTSDNIRAARDIAEAAEEIERLRAIKEPEGNKSESQQARAWVAVYHALCEVGLLSFLPTPLMACSRERCVQFISQLAASAAGVGDMSEPMPQPLNVSLEQKLAIQLEWARGQLERLRADNERLSRALSPTEGVWIWQGDGGDHPESLTCQVLMTANQVRRLIADLEEACNTLDYIATNYDCDSDAHRYGTPCRACEAKYVLGKIEAARAAGGDAHASQS